MKEFNTVDLRNQWEPLSTPELEAMLQTELERKPPDDEKVILLLHILEAREKDLPLQLSAREEEAWQRYKQKVMNWKGKKKFPIRWLSVAASVALIVAIFVSVVPKQAEAEIFWEMLQRWSDSILEIINPREHISSFDYHFETENPGLQQIYDSVVELGVTEPVVPMWLPDGSELTELTSKQTPMAKGIWSRFLYGDTAIIYKLDLYDGEPAHQFYRDDSYYEEYEKNGTSFYITQNNCFWTAVWTKNNIECSISIDCQEDTLRRILESIYVMEDN